MKISELIEELESAQFDFGDIDVMVTADYGDHAHTEQALEIQTIELGALKRWSKFSLGWKFAEPDAEESYGAIFLRT